jgi:hypothetical protein
MTDWDTAAWPAASAAVAAMVARAPLEIGPDPAAAMTEAGGWCGQALAAQAARLGVAAWAMATGGDDSLLLRVGDAEQAGFFLHSRDWVIAPGPVVTRIRIWRLEVPSLGAPLLGTVRLEVSWDFTGAQRYGGPAAPPGWRGPGDWEFTGMLTLELTGDEPFPWRLTSGHVDSLDHALGYTFRTRDETPQEYRARTGAAVSARPLVRSASYLLQAGFAEHDHKFGGTATAEISSDQPPTRAQAQRLAEEAIEAEALRHMARMYPRWDDLKEGDARPSLNSLEVIRLLDAGP